MHLRSPVAIARVGSRYRCDVQCRLGRWSPHNGTPWVTGIWNSFLPGRRSAIGRDRRNRDVSCRFCHRARCAAYPTSGNRGDSFRFYCGPGVAAPSATTFPRSRPIPVFDLSAKPPLGTVQKADKTRPACARLCMPVSCPHHLFSAVDAATFKAVRRSSGVPCNNLRITATSARIPVRSAGSASGANNGEWLEGSDIPFALAWA